MQKSITEINTGIEPAEHPHELDVTQKRILSEKSHGLIQLSAQEAKQIIDAGKSDATNRAFLSDQAIFETWMQKNFPELQGDYYPIPMGIILTYITDSLKENFKVSTIKRRLSSLATAHNRRGLYGHNVHNYEVKELLRSASKRQDKHAETSGKKDAITLDVYQKLLAGCDTNTFIGLRDRAILSVGLNSGGRRRSELSALKYADLNLVNSNDRIFYEWTMVSSKTHSSADPALILPIMGDAAVWLKEWLDAANIKDGCVFRSISKVGVIGKSLTPASIRNIILKLQQAAGLGELNLSAHSIRSGFVTEAGRMGIPSEEAMSLSNHKDHKTFFSYYRKGSIVNNPANNLFDSEKLE